MPPKPLVSICIPAYEHPQFLRRSLDSISRQTFKDFEVIVTDDTRGSELMDVCAEYSDRFTIRYHWNETRLGTPANWNRAIDLANGDWIKIMHHDDWFSENNSLEEFINVARENPSVKFFYSAYRNVFENNVTQEITGGIHRARELEVNPMRLLASNFIGPPSVTMYAKPDREQYDVNLKWLVDSEYYLRYPGIRNAVCIDQKLINIGVHASQVTASSFRNRNVEVPEYLQVLTKHGTKILRDIRVFDAYWRMLRNNQIRSEHDIRTAAYHDDIPDIIRTMIKFQSPVSLKFLRLGILSKSLMTFCFLYSKNSL